MRDGLRHELEAVNQLKALKIRAMVRTGKSWREVSYPFNVTADQAKRLVRMLGIREANPVRSKTELVTMLLERRAAGRSLMQAAFEVGVGVDAARRLVKRLGASCGH